MSTFKYLGISKEQRERMLIGQGSIMKPQDPRARPPLYHIDQKDSDEVKEEKKARIAKWKAGAKADFIAELDAMDKVKVMKDAKGKKFEFEKGKPVEVPETSSLHKKLMTLCDENIGPFPQFELVSDKTKKAEPKVEK